MPDAPRPSTAAVVVIDIWGGEGSQDHVARFLRPFDDATAQLVRHELASGYLINLRQEAAWGDAEEWDERRPGGLANA